MTKEENKRRRKRPRALLSVILSMLLFWQCFMGSTPVYASPSPVNFSGELTTTNTFHRLDIFSNGDNDSTRQIANFIGYELSSDSYNYFTRSLTPDTTGDYTIEVASANLSPAATYYGYGTPQSPIGATDDTVLFLYDGSFNPESPMTGLLYANDDIAYIDNELYNDNNNFKSRLSNISLTAGQTYVLVVTSFIYGVTGTIDFTASGPGTLSVTGNQYSSDMMTISGNAGIGGAVLSYNDGTAKTVTADSSGIYLLDVPSGWSGTVAPSKSGYTFTPASYTYGSINANQTSQNFTAIPSASSISGTWHFDFDQEVKVFSGSIIEDGKSYEDTAGGTFQASNDIGGSDIKFQVSAATGIDNEIWGFQDRDDEGMHPAIDENMGIMAADPVEGFFITSPTSIFTLTSFKVDLDYEIGDITITGYDSSENQVKSVTFAKGIAPLHQIDTKGILIPLDGFTGLNKVAISVSPGSSGFTRNTLFNDFQLENIIPISDSGSASSDAGLSSVLGETITAGSETGTSGEPKTATITVANEKSSIGLADIGTAANATAKLYSNAGFTEEITGSSTIALIEGGATTAYIKVTAQDETTIKYYAVTISREAALNNDATLKASPTVKGQTVTDLGTPHGALASVVAGSVTLSAEQAADTSNSGSYVTLFDSNDSNATVQVVKYASGASPDEAAFTGAAPYGNEAVSNGDFFIIKVVAQDESTTLYYKVNVTVTPASVAPGITGPTAMGLTEGYSVTSTGVYTITGTAPVTVTKTSGNGSITWNDTTKKLDIAAGLAAGSYPVELTAGNGTAPDATLTFILTVGAAFTPSGTRQEISPTVAFDKYGYATITNVPVIPSGYTLMYVVDFGDCGSYTNIADVNEGVEWLGTSTPLTELINDVGSWYIDDGNYKARGTYSEGSKIDIRSGSKSLLLTVVRYQEYGNIPGEQPWIYGAYLCAIPQKITYNLNGGNIDGDTAAKTEYLFNGDTLATTFNAPTKGDSPFKGWYTAGTGGSKVTSATGSSATYYAQWESRLPVNNTAGAATVAYGGTEIDLTAVSGLFTVDSNAGSQTFTVEEGGTGAGTVSGNLLTVTEAGTIEIGLITAETSTHQAGAKITATITVDKGTQDAPAGLGKTDAGSYGGSDGKITGLIPNRLYEYKKDGGAYTAATANTSGEITGLSAGTYVVRLAGNDLYHAGSDSAEIIIGQATQPGVLAFSNAAYTIGEDGGGVTITVTRTGGSNGAVSVDYATSDGTATAGSDYTATSGTLNFADGDAASKTFTVAISQDAILEGNETVNLTLSNATGGATLGQSSATLTIMDDEVASPNVTANDLTNQITGADNTMEYSTNGGTTWTAYDSANPPTFTGNQTVQVRIKASGSNPAGPATTLTFTVNLSEDAAVTTKATSYNISGNTIQSNTAVIHIDVTVESFLGNLNKHENAAWKIIPEGTPMASPTDFANATAKAAAAKLAKGDKLAVLAEDGVTLKVYAMVLTESNDAGMAGIAGTAIIAGNEAGTKEAPKTASVNVAHAKSSIGLADIGAAANATVKLYSDAAFSQEITGSSTLALTSGGATTAYIKVTAQDGTTVQYYKVTINRAASSRSDNDDDSSPSTSNPTPTPTQPTTPANPAAIPVNVTDNHANSTTKTIHAQITNDSNGTKTLSFKPQEAILEKKPNGTIQVKNLANGTESQFKVTFDLGNGQKIAIGRIEVKVDKDGAISLTSTLIDPYGIILDSATNQPITGVDVKLYYADTARNRASGKTPDTLVALPTLTGFEPNDNANPQVSNSYGAYAYMVFPQSDYYLLATKAGYERYKSPIITVEQDIVKWDFKMHQSLSGVQRLFGSNRIETAIAIAQANYPGKVTNVVLATATNYPDALAGSVLAYKLNAPLLLVGSTAQDQESLLNYLKEHVETAGTITILGGTGAVPAAVEERIQAHGYSQIIRLGGANRYETALRIAEELKVEQGRPVILVYGGNYPDALSVSSAAAAIQSPILLVEKNGISEGVKNKLAQIKPIKVYIIGLEGVISQQVEDGVAQLTSLKQENIIRIGGPDRYQTSLAVAEYFNLSGKNIGIATGNNFPDALAGSVYAANHNAPILLLNDTIPNDVMDYLKSREMTGATIFGGEAVINAEIEQKLRELIK
ncbi:DUF4073 domain-containing protein [Desulfitobacterium chlororespirans]|uniref:Putative cell wall-binding protein n=1 Tax=Desulfitobacterium chlororespirans DSM 11544 TaxID=1121395 RepID=A0A1M7SH58_9FIRM|nr:DUF4073 domain-containing protein [Desulfitobacterium chlororespirans]SHN57818.1 Putative cell wall-binding protein [Desulfitobacterium chlororespirans DSM 11544]